MKKTIIDLLRWLLVLPASTLGAYLVYVLFLWLNMSKDYPYTNFDALWDYAIDFVAHILMGGAFVWIGTYIAPNYKRVSVCVLFGIICALAGIAIFSNIVVGFDWKGIIGTVCLIGGAGFVLYSTLNDDEKIT